LLEIVAFAIVLLFHFFQSPTISQICPLCALYSRTQTQMNSSSLSTSLEMRPKSSRGEFFSFNLIFQNFSFFLFYSSLPFNSNCLNGRAHNSSSVSLNQEGAIERMRDSCAIRERILETFPGFLQLDSFPFFVLQKFSLNSSHSCS